MGIEKVHIEIERKKNKTLPSKPYSKKNQAEASFA